MTDRDHFAAAAMTGMLAQGDDGSFSEQSYARGAYRWADAMLRERSESYGEIDEKCRDSNTIRSELTESEREAVNDAIYLCGAEAGLAGEQANATAWATYAATLRGLLDRMQ